MAAGKNRKGIQPHGSRRADGEAKPICQPPPPPPQHDSRPVQGCPQPAIAGPEAFVT